MQTAPANFYSCHDLHLFAPQSLCAVGEKGEILPATGTWELQESSRAMDLVLFLRRDQTQYALTLQLGRKPKTGQLLLCNTTLPLLDRLEFERTPQRDALEWPDNSTAIQYFHLYYLKAPKPCPSQILRPWPRY